MRRSLLIGLIVTLVLSTLGWAVDYSRIGQTESVDDSTVFSMREDWMPSVVGTGTLAQYGWTVRSIGGSPTTTFIAGVYPNLGIAHLATTTTDTQGASIGMDTNSIGPLGNMAAYAFDSRWVFRIPTTTTVRVRVGFFAGTGAGATEPADGMWVRYDTTVSDTAFFFETRGSSNSTPVTSGVNVNANFNTIRIRSVTPGTILFSLNGGAETSIAATVPTANMTPGAIVTTAGVGVSRTLDLDFFGMRVAGLGR